MSNRLTIAAVGLFGLALFSGIASAVPEDHDTLTSVTAACEYTDRTNCDYDGQY